MKGLYLPALFFLLFNPHFLVGQEVIRVQLYDFECKDNFCYKENLGSVKRQDLMGKIMVLKWVSPIEIHEVKIPMGYQVFNSSRTANVLSETANNSFKVLFGKVRGTSRIVAFIDRNLNQDFSDDSCIRIDQKNGLSDIIELPVSSVIGKSSFANTSLFVQFGLYNFTVDGKTGTGFFEMALKKLWKGSFNWQGTQFDVGVSGMKKGFGQKIFIALDNNVSPRPGVDFFYKEGDTVFTRKHVFYVKDLDTGSRQLTILYLGENLNKTGVKPGFFIENFEFTDVLTGRVRKLFNRYKPYTLIDCWGTWCVPCIALTPDLKKMAERFKDRLEIVGLAVDESKNPVIQYLKKTGILWPNMFEPIRKQQYQKIDERLKIDAYPTFILTNKDGLILIRTITAEGLREIAAFLEKNPG